MWPSASRAYELRDMTSPQAREICGWRYPPPYDVYDSKLTVDAMREYLNGTYSSVEDRQGFLVGFVCFGTSAQVPLGSGDAYDRTELTDIGLGLRPDLCGQGQGAAIFLAGMDLARRRLGATGFRLTVASFNRRAITVYERAGFTTGQRFVSGTAGREREFVVMTLDPSPVFPNPLRLT